MWAKQESGLTTVQLKWDPPVHLRPSFVLFNKPNNIIWCQEKNFGISGSS